MIRNCTFSRILLSILLYSVSGLQLTQHWFLANTIKYFKDISFRPACKNVLGSWKLWTDGRVNTNLPVFKIEVVIHMTIWDFYIKKSMFLHTGAVKQVDLFKNELLWHIFPTFSTRKENKIKEKIENKKNVIYFSLEHRCQRELV